MIKRPLRALAVLTAALGLTLAATQPATASSDGPTLCWPGACSSFHSDGDVVWVGDNASNGYAAVVQVYVPDVGISDNLWNTAGYGWTEKYSYGTRIPEGTVVYYRPCNGTTPLDCNPGWTHGVA